MLVVVSSLAPPALSQQADPDPFAGVEEMVVTGSGTAALLAPQSTSAIAFDTAALDAYGVEDLGDIAAYVPNLEIRSVNATNASFFVRGVGLQDFGANASSSVPIFQDGVPRNPSATQLTGLYDIGGLSVLRGPQGSDNRRNASAGAFLIQTAKPEPDYSGFATATVARITSVDARDANRYSMEAAMNAPVFEDIISVRLSARYSHENPWFENGCANRVPIEDRPERGRGPGGLDEPGVRFCGETFQRRDENNTRNGKSHVEPFLSKYLGEVDDYAFRGQIRINPPDNPMDWTFRAELSNLNRDSTLGQVFGTGGGLGGEDSAGYRDPDITARFNELEPGVAAANPGVTGTDLRNLVLVDLGKELYKDPLDQKPFRGDFDSPGRVLLETHSASTTGLIDLDDFDVEINFGFLDYRLSEKRDTDLTPNIRFPSRGNNQAWELYGDTKFSGETIGDLPLEWDTGFYTLVQKVEAFQIQQILEVERSNQFTEEIYSFGVFAQGRYEFLEAFTLSAGMRYNWERKDFEVSDERDTTSSGGILIERESRNQRTWDALTGFAEIRYDFTEDFGAYMKYSRGFKAGHFNPSRADQAKNPDVGYADPEQIDALEWGLNFAAWAGRLTGDGALFFYNYKNYQVFRLTTEATGVFRSINSARRARNYGAEFDITISPLEGFVPEEIEGLRFNFRGGWLETSYIDFTIAEQRQFPGGNIGVPIDYSGNSLISAPNLQFSGTLTWPVLLGRFGTFTPQYDFTWTDDTPFDPNEGRGELDAFGNDRFQSYLVGNRAFVLHNIRLSWSPPGESGLAVSGWCRNIEDRRYKTFAVDISTFSGQQLIFTSDPRMCGADIRFSW
jgi:outer membrane receptor protein involved in Fe transport